MQDRFSRTQRLLGEPALQALAASRVAVFGCGGVGGYVVEVLARSGVGAIDLIDDDCVAMSNLNRQIIALESTVGRPKVEVARERVLGINPACKVTARQMRYLVANADELDLACYDYVVDCIDTVSAKMELVRRCQRLGVPHICSMGAANKMDATAFRVTDISKTKNDPLAKVMRRKLRKEGIMHFKCVCSDELPLVPLDDPSAAGNDGRVPPASNAFVPAAAGVIVGAEVVKDLITLAGAMRPAARRGMASTPSEQDE